MLSKESVSGVSSFETRAAAKDVGAGGGGEDEFVELAMICCVIARLRMFMRGKRSMARLTAKRNVFEFMRMTLPKSEGHLPYDDDTLCLRHR